MSAGIIWAFLEFSNLTRIPTICPFLSGRFGYMGSKYQFFFSDKYLVLIRTRLLLQRNLLRKKKPYPWNNKLYPFIRQCVSVGESGLLLAVKPPNTDTFYLGPKTMNEKKIMKNVLQLGDEFFNFGDLVYLDHDYYVYFRDRIGDTFR